MWLLIYSANFNNDFENRRNIANILRCWSVSIKDSIGTSSSTALADISLQNASGPNGLEFT